MNEQAHQADEQRRLQGEIEAAIGNAYRLGLPEEQVQLLCWAAGIDSAVVKRQLGNAA